MKVTICDVLSRRRTVKTLLNIGAALTLSMALMFSTSFSSLYYFHFLLNQDEIAEEFCENKDKPEMHCHGKCHAHKELKKMEKKETKQDAQIPADIETKPIVLLVYEVIANNESDDRIAEDYPQETALDPLSGYYSIPEHPPQIG